MGSVSFILNHEQVEVDGPTGRPLLDTVRGLGLSGTKEGCREGDCGACVVLVGRLDGSAVRYENLCSCLLPVAVVAGCHVVTVEGLDGPALTPVQQAIVDEGATQCGFCTPGIVLSATGYLLEAPRPTAEGAVRAVEGNICRCTGYGSIRRALDGVVRRLDDGDDGVEGLIRAGVVPAYFAGIADRLRALEIAPCDEPDAAPLVAGGTDLYVQRNRELAGLEPRLAPTQRRIEDRGDHLLLGAGVTFEDVNRSPLLAELVPRLGDFLRLVASQPIRRRATLAGNVVNASPIGDLTILLLALDAEVELVGGGGRRSLPLRRLFTGYKQLDRAPDEVLDHFRVALPSRPLTVNFEKVSKRTHLDIASVNSAASFVVHDGLIRLAHLSAGGVAPVPLYLERTSAKLVGAPPTAATARAAAAVAEAEIAPISDVRGSAAYKRLLLRQLIYAHFHELFGLGPELLAEAG